MNTKKDELSLQHLREKAETMLLYACPTDDQAALLAGDQLLHELRVHQIELKMQNEELRRAQLALEKSHAHYLELYDFAPVGYLTLNRSGMVIECNLTAARLLGAERKHMINQRFERFIEARYKDQWYLHLLTAWQAEDQYNTELPCRIENGKAVYFHINCLVKKEDQSSPLLNMALTDITAQKLAELDLQESEIRLSLAIDELQAGYWEWNLETNTVFFSPIWKQQLGFDDQGLPNRFEELESRLHPDDHVYTLDSLKNCLKEQLPKFEREFRLRHKDGSYRWIHSRAIVIQQPKRLVGIHLDISDYKNAKELSDINQKMEEIFRLHVAIQTAATIANQLNQPLCAISFYSDIANEMLSKENQDLTKLRHILESCTQQAARAGRITWELLSSLQKREIFSETIDINKMVNAAIEFIRANGRLDTKIKLNMAAGLPLVTGNSLHIQKILIILLENALDATKTENSDEVIDISAGICPNDSSRVQVTVRDYRKGASNIDILNNKSQPLYGLCMNLAIARSLVEIQGGSLWSEQKPDAGLSIHFTLPFEAS